MDAKEEDVSNGVQRIALTHWLQSNEKGSTDLFSRTCQRELWNEVYAYLEATHNGHAMITGNPGIGKSRSMTYLLRVLLQNGKTVIYQARKDDRVYVFVPPNGHRTGSEYKVWGSNLSTWAPGGCLVAQNANHYCLIDPDLPAAIVGISSHIVLSASPNPDHFKEFLKLQKAITWCMPIWKKQELKVLQPYLEIENNVKLTDVEFEARYFDFGGRIRFLYATQPKFKNNWTLLKTSIRKLGLSELTKALAYEVIEMSQSDKGTPSMLFVYDVLGEPSTYSSITYKYLQEEGNMKVLIASERVRQLLCANYWNEIMNVLNPNSFAYSGNATSNGRLFELVSRVYLEFEVKLDARSDSKNIDHQFQVPEGKRREVGGSWDQYLVECSKLQTSSSITSGPRDIVSPKATNQPVLDMMDACDRAYQFAVGKEHGVNLIHLQTIVQILKLTPQDPLKLYFVIPEFNVSEFKWKFDGQSKIGKKSSNFVKSCVKIYMICVPKDPYWKIQEMIEMLKAK